MIRARIVTILVGSGLVLAACGGGSPTAAPGQTTSIGETTATTSALETSSATETTQAETTASTTAGGGSADACKLLTAEEVQQVTGYPDITVQPVAEGETDAESSCAFVSSGVFPAAILSILDPANTNTDISGYLALPLSEEVAVSGAKAVFAPAAGNVLFVIKGDTVASVLITAQQGEAIDAAKAVVQRVADRL